MVRPHYSKVKYRLEMVNEFILIVFGYHMLTFTHWTDTSTQFDVGYSYIGTTLFIVFLNMGVMAVYQISKLQRKLRLDKLRKIQLKMLLLIEKDIRDDRQLRVQNQARRGLIRDQLDLRT
jgi:hypothetical protein